MMNYVLSLKRTLLGFVLNYPRHEKQSYNPVLKRVAQLAESFVADRLGSYSVGISIIIPFNEERVKEFESILARACSDEPEQIEVIVFAEEFQVEAAELVFRQTARKVDFEPEIKILSGRLTEAIQAATQDFCVILGDGCILLPNSLSAVLRILEEGKEKSLVYTDSAKLHDHDGELIIDAKPAYDPVLFAELDYINDAAFFHREKLQNYLSNLENTALANSISVALSRYILALDENAIGHFPFPAVGLQFEYQRNKRIIEQKTQNSEEWPEISIIIPTRNSLDLICKVLRGIYERTDYPSFEVILVDNGSNDERVLELYDAYSADHSNFAAHINPEPFNFSRAVNKGIALAKGAHFLLLNNDIEIIDSGWLKEMVSCLEYQKTGIVGARLLFPNDTIQHAGVIVGMNGMASHWHYKQSKDVGGPMGRLQVRNSMTCVTAAVMLISKDCVEVLGDWNEQDFAVAYNDVDYCIRAREAGFRTIWTPYATLYHHESVSRKKDKSHKRKRQFETEKNALKSLHETTTFDDPAFSPWYARRPGKPQVRFPRKMPELRTWWD
jgi:GT2 family glycosyltransferase